MPHTVPLVGAVLFLFLMVLPIQDAMHDPTLFQISLVLVVLAAFGWILVTLGNDYAHFKHGLLKPQRPTTVLFMVLIGVTLVTLRSLNLTAAPTLGQATSIELLQRHLVGIPYFTFRFFGLDMWGLVIGIVCFIGFFSFGFLAFCLFNCCGRVRLLQSLLRKRRDAMPFMDMVSNRFTLFSYNAVLFVYPFAILTTFVIGGTVLIE